MWLLKTNISSIIKMNFFEIFAPLTAALTKKLF